MTTTTIRVQPMRASVAMLAAEHERLDRAKTKLEKEIAEMGATQTPTGDDLVRALASEVAAEEARVAAKREALARAEAALGTQTRDRAAEVERRWQEEELRLRAALLAAEAVRLEACARAERSWRIAIVGTPASCSRRTRPC